jgi:xylulokinase
VRRAAKGNGMILAIDLGSTSFKAAVFDAEQRRVGQGACILRYTYGAGGRVELDADHVVDAVRTAVGGALDRSDAACVTAVAITSQAQTFTITDSRFTPLMPFVSWMDTRGAAACGALAADLALAEVARHVSFPALLAGQQVCQVRRVRDTQPDLLADAHRVLLLPSWVTALLTGTAVCDTNLAAMSGLYSMVSGAWWPAALDACGLRASQLPALAGIGCPVGRTGGGAVDLGLPPGLPVVAAGNDQTAGAFGAGVHGTDALLITLGTCQVAYRAPAPAPRAERTVVAGPYPDGGWYALAADHCGGSLVNWAETVLEGCETDARFFAAAAASPPGCHGVVFEPGASHDDHAWRNRRPEHTPGDLARAVIEALVRRMTGLVADVCGGTLPGTLLVAGGGSRAPLWVALQSDALGRDLVPTEADPLAGAARMAAQAGTVEPVVGTE